MLSVEDEFHFLCICNKSKDIREGLYNKFVSRNVSFASLSNEDKFIYLMKFENVEVAKFFVRAYEVEKVSCAVLRYYKTLFLSTCTAMACSRRTST